MVLPITVKRWGFDVHKPGTVLGPRVLPNYDFIWVIDGEVLWEVDRHQHCAPAGSLILVRSGMRDTVNWNASVATRNFFVHFDLHHVDHLPPERTWPLVRVLPDRDIARPLLMHLAWVLDHRPLSWDVLASQDLMQLLTVFVFDAFSTTDGQHSRLTPVLERLVTHIAGQWGRIGSGSFGLDGLATAAGVSRESLCRIFKREIGCPPLEALRQIRLDRAATLLRRQGRSVAEVARLSGFPDQFHFSRRFNDAYGCPPSEYRKRILEGGATATILAPGIQALARRLWEELGNPDD